MSDPTTPPTQTAAWHALTLHHAGLAPRHLRELFADDPDRGTRLTAEAAGLYLDYSKHRVTDETLGLLLDLAGRVRACRERIDAMFRGDHINVTEDRAVLHVALRMPRGSSLVVDGVDVVARGARRARPHARLHRQGAPRRVARPLGRAHHATWSTSASAGPTSAR